MSRTLLAAAAVVLAFFVARLTAATESEPVEATVAPVRAERVAYMPVAPSPSIARAETPAPEPAAPQQPATNVVRQVNQLVDRALAHGQWKTADRMELSAMLGQLSEMEANIVLGKLFTSINAGRLTVESTPL